MGRASQSPFRVDEAAILEWATFDDRSSTIIKQLINQPANCILWLRSQISVDRWSLNCKSIRLVTSKSITKVPHNEHTISKVFIESFNLKPCNWLNKQLTNLLICDHQHCWFNIQCLLNNDHWMINPNCLKSEFQQESKNSSKLTWSIRSPSRRFSMKSRLYLSWALWWTSGGCWCGISWPLLCCCCCWNVWLTCRLLSWWFSWARWVLLFEMLLLLLLLLLLFRREFIAQTSRSLLMIPAGWEREVVSGCWMVALMAELVKVVPGKSCDLI